MTDPFPNDPGPRDTVSTLLLLAGSVAVGVALSQLFGDIYGRPMRGEAADDRFFRYGSGDEHALPPDVEAPGSPAAAYGDPERAALGLGTEGAPRP